MGPLSEPWNESNETEYIKKKGLYYFVSGAVLFSFTPLVAEECPLLAGCAVRERAHTVFTAISILHDLRYTADLSAVD